MINKSDQSMSGKIVSSLDASCLFNCYFDFFFFKFYFHFKIISAQIGPTNF